MQRPIPFQIVSKLDFIHLPEAHIQETSDNLDLPSDFLNVAVCSDFGKSLAA